MSRIEIPPAEWAGAAIMYVLFPVAGSPWLAALAGAAAAVGVFWLIAR